jgi:menaquinone-dependent protoporphyrinogen IX oxidase
MEQDHDKRERETRAAFPSELAARAVAVAFLGGRFQFAKMSAPERFIIKRIVKAKTDMGTIDTDAIAEFVQAVVSR